MTKRTSIGAAVVITVVGLLLRGWGLAAAEPQIKAGDKIVVLHDTHIQAGAEKLAPVQAGTVLAATQVQDDWIAVTVERDGKTVSGWISANDLTGKLHQEFVQLIVSYSQADPGHPVVEAAVQSWFQQIDENKDGKISADEFAARARLPTLDDLNAKLRKILGPGLGIGLSAEAKYGEMLNCVLDFKGWKCPPRPDFGKKIYSMVDAFVRTKDLRRSRLTEEFLAHEAPDDRSQRAAVSFKWADKDRSGDLSPEEFMRAVGKTTSFGEAPPFPPPRMPPSYTELVPWSGNYIWVPALREWLPCPAGAMPPTPVPPPPRPHGQE